MCIRDSLTTSFDIEATTLPNIEISGTKGSMVVSDPNLFQGNLQVRTLNSRTWQKIKPARPFNFNARGIGLLDMAIAIRDNRPHRASGELAAHVVEIMEASLASHKSGKHVTITSKPERPAPVPPLKSSRWFA